MNKIQNSDFKLEDLLEISNGCKPYQAGYGKNLSGVPFTKEDVKNRIYHSFEKEDETYYPELKGRDVKRFHIDEAKNYIKWGDWLMSPKDKKFQFSPKILLRQIIGEKFICSIDTNNHIADQSLYILINKEGQDFSLTSMLGVLNSKLLSFFFRKYYSEEDDLFPKIKVNELKKLPIVKFSPKLDSKISDIVQTVITTKRNDPLVNTTELEHEIDHLVYELYGLTEEEIEVVEGS